MVESIVELLFGLFWAALILLIIFCIVGSIVGALRAVRREGDGEREETKDTFVFGAEMTGLDDRRVETGVIVIAIPENRYGL
jgi:hypothetical protein